MLRAPEGRHSNKRDATSERMERTSKKDKNNQIIGVRMGQQTNTPTHTLSLSLFGSSLGRTQTLYWTLNSTVSLSTHTATHTIGLFWFETTHTHTPTHLNIL